MKTQTGSRSLLWILASISLLLTPLIIPGSCVANEPVITSIVPEGTNVLVTVRVPSGVQRVTLESRARFGAGTWAPLAVAQAVDSEKSLTFRVPCSRAAELIRARTDTSLPLPQTFYTGTNSFLSPASAGASTTGTTSGGTGVT